MLLAFPIVLAKVSTDYFNKKQSEVLTNLASDQGRVAGDTTLSVDSELVKQVPIPGNSTIVSIDTSDKSTSMTLETTRSKDQIIDFYDEYFYVNNFAKTEDHEYLKDNKTYKLSFSEGVVVINYYEN